MTTPAKQFMRQQPMFLALAILAVAVSTPAMAAPVTFWYGGYIRQIDNPSNAMPFAVSEGMPFTGRITYDSALAASSTNTTPEGKYSLHYFNSNAGFSSLLQIGGHILTNAAIPGYYCGQASVYDGPNNGDGIYLETSGGADLKLDGNTFVTAPLFSLIVVGLWDGSKTALNNPGLPTQAPNLPQFPEQHDMVWGVYIDDGGPTRVFQVTGEITVITTNEVVFLRQTKTGPDTLRLSWPNLHTGFTLQSSTNPATGGWQNVTNPVTAYELEHAVTTSTAGAPKYFRLKK